MDVMTVLGPVKPDQLGITTTHEHLLCDLSREFFWEGLLNDEALAIEEAGRFKAAGGRTLVDVTTFNLGRKPEAIKRIAEATGLQVVMGTGFYREPYYDMNVNEMTANQIAAEMVRDIREGVGNSGIRAGIIGEIGPHRHYVSAVEERAFRAAARAHKETGVTISTHANRHWAGLQQLDIFEEEGVDLQRVVIGHCDCPDHEPGISEYLERIARRGAFVQFDTVRGANEYDTRKRGRLALELIEKGFINQLLLAHDVCFRGHLKAYGGNGYDFIPSKFAPMLREAGLSQAQVDTLLIANPRRALAGE